MNWEDTAEALNQMTYNGVFVIEAFANDIEGFSKVAHVWRPLPCEKLELSQKSLDFFCSLRS